MSHPSRRPRAATLSLLGLAALLPACEVTSASLDLRTPPNQWSAERGDHGTYLETARWVEHALQHLEQSPNAPCAMEMACALHATRTPGLAHDFCYCAHPVGESMAADASLVSGRGVATPVRWLASPFYYAAVEDSDPLFTPPMYRSTVLFDRPGPRHGGLVDVDAPIGLDEPFEIVFRFLAVDAFTEGRLRDLWGGSGGELSLQVALNALSHDGALLQADRDLLLREQVKARSPVLTLLRASERGADLVDDIEDFARRLSAYRAEARAGIGELRVSIEGVQWRIDEELTDLDERLREWSVLQAELRRRLDEAGTPDDSAMLPELAEAAMALDAALLDAEERLRDELDDASTQVLQELASLQPRLEEQLERLEQRLTRALDELLPDSLRRSSEIPIDASVDDDRLTAQVARSLVDRLRDSLIDPDVLAGEVAQVLAPLRAMLQTEGRERSKLQDELKRRLDEVCKALGSFRGATQLTTDATVGAVREAAARQDALLAQLDGLSRAAHALAAELAGRLADGLAPVDERLAEVDALLERSERFGVDADGLFQVVDVVTGLADADHDWRFDTDGVRPGLASPGGSASIAWCQAPRHIARDADVARETGVIFSGTLGDLAQVSGDAGGLSLSVLLLERDDDDLVRALELVRSQTGDDVEIAGFDANVVLEALSTIATRIADDDIELRSLDLRFVAGDVTAASTQGREVFRLKPCAIVISRNLVDDEVTEVAQGVKGVGLTGPEFQVHPAASFGALAVIQIRRLEAAGALVAGT